jgi:hypothetical protein
MRTAAPDRCAVHRDGNDPSADTVRVLDQDFIMCRAEPYRHFEARPGLSADRL